MTEKSQLITEHYPNQDFFYASTFTISTGKLHLDMLEHPFFSLQSRGKDMSTFEYTSNDGSFSLKIVPSVKGRATMSDADLVAFIQAKLVKMKEDGELVTDEPVLAIEVTEFLEFTNRTKGGENYKSFKDMLVRLSGTFVEITRVDETGARLEEQRASVIKGEFTTVRSKDGDKPLSFIVQVNKWFVKPILESNRYLTIPREYFRLKKDTHKRYWHIARMHAGGYFEISWEKFKNKVVGETNGTLTKFRSKIRKEMKDNGGVITVLDYVLKESEDKRKVIISKASVIEHKR